MSTRKRSGIPSGERRAEPNFVERRSRPCDGSKNWSLALLVRQIQLEVWLAPALSDRIEGAGMPTLSALVERVNGVGSRWWSGIPGIGRLKASRMSSGCRPTRRTPEWPSVRTLPSRGCCLTLLGSTRS